MMSAASEYSRLVSGSAAGVASKTAAKMMVRSIELKARSSSLQLTTLPSLSSFPSTMRKASSQADSTPMPGL